MPRPAVAKARAARVKRDEQARRAAAAAACRAQRRVAREKLGRLRDRVVRPGTLKRYTAHATEFYRFARRTGHATPRSVEVFDVLLSHWAEHLWSEGDSRSILNNGLCGLAHFVPMLRNKLHGSWRLYRAWVKSVKPRQGPPLTRLMCQAFAGELLRMGFRRAAVMVLVAHECILRNSEFMEVRHHDCVDARNGILLRLRGTKIGQRLGIHQEVF